MWDFLLKTAGNILGSKTESGESQLLELFKGQKEKIREFQLALEAHFQARLEMALNDRENARAMQVVALKQNDWFAKNFLNLLTLFILFVTAFLAVFPLFVEVPEVNKAMLTRATDFFYMIAGGSVIGFFYGTNTEKLK